MKPSPREEGLRWLRQAQQDADADRALELAEDAIRFVEGRFPPEAAIDDDDDDYGGGE